MRKLIPITLAMATLAGCTTAMVPVGTNRDVAGEAAVEITVGQEFPTFRRSDPYTPIHLTIRNNTSERVQLRYSFFTLHDPAGRTYLIAPLRDVIHWLRRGFWNPYYAPFYPRPISNYVFREGRLAPHGEIQAVVFFHQATHFGQGDYRLVANIPQNGRPTEFVFRLR